MIPLLQNIQRCTQVFRGDMWLEAHVHLKPSWQQPPGSWLAVQLPGTEQPTELGPAQGLEAGMVYRQSGSAYRLGLAVCSERSWIPPFCSSWGPTRHVTWACQGQPWKQEACPKLCTGEWEGLTGLSQASAWGKAAAAWTASVRGQCLSDKLATPFPCPTLPPTIHAQQGSISSDRGVTECTGSQLAA